MCVLRKRLTLDLLFSSCTLWKRTTTVTGSTRSRPLRVYRSKTLACRPFRRTLVRKHRLSIRTWVPRITWVPMTSTGPLSPTHWRMGTTKERRVLCCQPSHNIRSLAPLGADALFIKVLNLVFKTKVWIPITLYFIEQMICYDITVDNSRCISVVEVQSRYLIKKEIWNHENAFKISVSIVVVTRRFCLLKLVVSDDWLSKLKCGSWKFYI